MRNIGYVVFCVTNSSLADVIHMFGDYLVEVYDQKELDAMIQSAIYTQDENCFIAHQDRPYVVNLSKALYIKKYHWSRFIVVGFMVFRWEQDRQNQMQISIYIMT